MSVVCDFLKKMRFLLRIIFDGGLKSTVRKFYKRSNILCTGVKI